MALLHAADDRLAVGTRPGAVKAVGKLAAAGDDAEDVGAARRRGIIALQHQGAGTFRHDEAVAVLGERLCRRLRRVVLHRQCGEQREPDQAFRVDRTVGRDAQRRVGFAAPDRFEPELDRARARRAGGRERNRRAFGAEGVGKRLADRAEQEALVIANGSGPTRRRAAGRRSSTVPFAPDPRASASRCGHSISIGRDREEQRPRETAARSDPASRDRLFDGDFREALGERRRRE